jgi:hypothetical protein
VVVQPVMAVASRRRLTAASRRWSQSRPIMPTPASGWRVSSHPVHRWPTSSRMPGWVNQQGGVDGGRDPVGGAEPGDSFREVGQLTGVGGGVEVVPAHHHGDRWCTGLAPEHRRVVGRLGHRLVTRVGCGRWYVASTGDPRLVWAAWSRRVSWSNRRSRDSAMASTSPMRCRRTCWPRPSYSAAGTGRVCCRRSRSCRVSMCRRPAERTRSGYSVTGHGGHVSASAPHPARHGKEPAWHAADAVYPPRSR